MPRLPKSSLRIVLVLVQLLALAACGAPKAPADSGATSDAGYGTPYKIGFLAAITGGGSTLGEPERDAAVMLQKQINAQGGVVGPDGVRHTVEIIIHDTEGNADVALPVAKKLIDDEGVALIIGPSISPVAMALIPVVQEARVSLISMASSSEVVEPVEEREWVFKVAQSNRHTAPWQVRYAQATGLTKIANLYVSNAYGEDGAEAIRRTAAEAGIEIVLEDTFAASDTDMTAQITKAKASDAQAVLVTAIPPAAAIFTKQYRELGVDLPLLHNSGIAMPSFVELAGVSNAEGVMFPMGRLVAADALPDDDPQKPVLQSFIADFEAEVGKPPSAFAAHGWDAIQISLQVFATFPDGLSVEEQRVRMRDGIEQVNGFVGVDGTFYFSPEDHVGLSEADVVLVRIEDGEWVYFPPEAW